MAVVSLMRGWTLECSGLGACSLGKVYRVSLIASSAPNLRDLLDKCNVPFVIPSFQLL